MKRPNQHKAEIAQLEYKLDKKKGCLKKMAYYRKLIPTHTTSDVSDMFLDGQITYEELLDKHNQMAREREEAKKSKDCTKTLFDTSAEDSGYVIDSKVSNLITDLQYAQESGQELKASVLKIIGEFLISIS